MNIKENKIEWIERKNPPKEDCLCYVTNVRARMDCFLALYSKYNNYFWMYDPSARQHPPIDVTHYIILPSAPLIKRGERPPVMEVRFKKSMEKGPVKTAKPKK